MAKNILIVDDSAVMRKMIVRNLRQAGLDVGQVFESSDGQQALETLQKNSGIQLILSDWNMPNMDGLTFVKSVRGKGIQTPIIMVTTEATDSRIEDAKKAGANGYICKPFTPYNMEKELKPFF